LLRPRRSRSGPYVLLFSIFVVATCAIVYELLISTVASYLQGDTILQFSITIGLFLTAMGIGSWCSRGILDGLVRSFVLIELLVGLAGGLSVPILFFVYGTAPTEFPPVMYGTIVVIGILIGLEVPLVTRILTGSGPLRANLGTSCLSTTWAASSGRWPSRSCFCRTSVWCARRSWSGRSTSWSPRPRPSSIASTWTATA